MLRPSVIFGAGDRFLNLFARLQKPLPVMALAGAEEARLQPVWVGDVAQAILRCLQDDATIGRAYELAGPGSGRCASWCRRRGAGPACVVAAGAL